MKQLLHSGLDFAIDEFPYVQDVFYHSQEESAVELYNKIIAQPKPLLNVFAGLDLVKKGSLAFNTDGIYAYAILKSMSRLSHMIRNINISYFSYTHR